jgi:hypothetical protein
MPNNYPPDPHQDDGRMMLGCGGILFIPIAVSGSWYLFFESPRPQGLFEWVVFIVMEELAIGGTLFFSLGFLWAITGSRQLKNVLDIASVRFAWILIPLAIPVFVLVAWLVIFR